MCYLLSAAIFYLLFAICLLSAICYLPAICLFARQCFCPFPHSPNACAKSPPFQANAFLIKHSALLILFFKKSQCFFFFFPFCLARYLLRAPRARSSPAHPSRPSHPASLFLLTVPLPRRSLSLVGTLRRNAKPRRPVPEKLAPLPRQPDAPHLATVRPTQGKRRKKRVDNGNEGS